MFRVLLSVWVAVLPAAVLAGPLIPAGDLTLRHDVQRLADYGIVRGTFTSWPLPWGPILADIDGVDPIGLPLDVAAALQRVRRHARWEVRSGEVLLEGSMATGGNATRIRSFQNTPRGDVEIAAGFGIVLGPLAADLRVQYVSDGQDDAKVRADDSFVGFLIGNWSLGVSTQQRWWGPGWDGSLILSNDARPFPAVTIDRTYTDAFDNKWLGWLGPWDLSLMFGQLEGDRVVPNAQFFGARFTFRPVPSLEVGLSRTAQWCGDGRPCGLDTFVDLLLGRDNFREDEGGRDTEPGNQMAGFDLRWRLPVLERNVAVYGQFIGEDEAGGLPSQYLGQVGAEWSGSLTRRWSARLYTEYARTSCDFFGASEFSSDGRNCAYNNSIYETGYRYRGRPIGHGADNDAELVTVGAILVRDDHQRWQAQVRAGTLNAGGAPDERHTLTPTPQDIVSVDVSHSRAFGFGTLEVGAGFERLDDEVTARTSNEGRFFLQWRSAF